MTDKYTSGPKSAKMNEKQSFSCDLFIFSTMISGYSANYSLDLNSLDNFGIAKCFLAPTSDIKLRI